MTHIQPSITNKNWIRLIKAGFNQTQNQVNKLFSTALQSMNLNVDTANQSKTQFITTREAATLATHVHRTSNAVYVNALGGSRLHFVVKRMVDLFVATSVLILSLPMLILCAIWVASENAGKLFATEQHLTANRVIKDGKYVWQIVPFARYKFHTSTQTTSGQFLQGTGLDSIPTLLNVLRGEMSIVGTQTITQEELDDYADWQILSMACKPGIIGLSRISRKLTWLANDRTRQEVWYACNQCPSTDLNILVNTFRSVMAI